MDKSQEMASENKEKISIATWLTCAYFICMPLSVVPLPGGISLLKAISFLVGGVLIVAMFIGEVKLRLNSVHMFLALYVAYTIFSILILNDANSWENIRGLLEVMAVFMVITSRIYNQREKTWIENSWIIVGLISVAMAFLSGSAVGGTDRTTISLGGAYEDPNQFCGYFILPVLAYLDRIIKKDKYRYLYVLLLPVTLYVIFNTGSRGGLIAVLIPVFVFVIMAIKGLGNKIKTVVALMLTAVTFYFVFFPLLPDSVTERFSVESVMEDKGSGRFEIWAVIIDAIVENDQTLILGQGIGSTVTILEEAGSVNNVAHNHWLQIWCDQGIIGVMIFTLLVISGMTRIYKKSSIVTVALIGMVALSMSLTLYAAYKPFWNVLIMSALNYEEELKYAG